MVFFEALLTVGIVPILLAVFTLVGIMFRNDYMLLGAAVIGTYLVWSWKLFPTWVVFVLGFIIVLWLFNISKQGGRRR